ncbi:MAG: thioredoxin domain-containing protein [Rhodospirillaceae bacterium]|nr:thioredoxin domain-containing protein [Rhodospirillaceae bacterium]
MPADRKSDRKPAKKPRSRKPAGGRREGASGTEAGPAVDREATPVADAAPSDSNPASESARREAVEAGARTVAPNKHGGHKLGSNNLGHETSPYLLQHADNPVHWQGWNEAAFEAAKEDNKPILLSVGYAACHWCHVMAHESFENDDIAAVMNELFVSIKVDREERPDVDQIYQTALALLGQAGGWPLTMFLTPKGEPFWGGTYFPPEPRYGRPGFADVLRLVAQKYRDEPDAVGHNVTALRNALEQLSTPKPGKGISRAITDTIAGKLMREFDPVHGGIGRAPKFPQCSLLELIWRSWKRTGETAHRDAVLRTLTRMSQGGIYDHLGGGFARYAVDDEWLVPHFEKMLYDNAQLIDLLVHAFQETKEPLYAQRVRETADWMLREMKAAPASDSTRGFASSWDADSEGVEGKFYVWQEGEIDALLGHDAQLFKGIYDVTAHGNWEESNILNRRYVPELRDDETEAKLARSRATLFAARENRVKPGFDDKVLADWNGMTIAALANAAAVFDERRWLTAAVLAFSFVCTQMQQGGRLRHSWRAGRAGHAATLDDYAQMIRAALALHETMGYEAMGGETASAQSGTGGDTTFLDQAIRWAETVERHYGDAENGGYFLTADDQGDLILRTKTSIDGATPGGNGVMAAVLARLFYLTGDDKFRARAQGAIDAFAGEANQRAMAMAALLNANETLQNGLQIILTGTAGSAEIAALAASVYGQSLPDRVLQIVADTENLPAAHPAKSKKPPAATAGSAPRAAAFVCRGQTCSLPITDPDGLARALEFA